MSLPRRERAKSQKVDHVASGAMDERPGAEMKRMEPRRGEGPYTMGRLERAVEQLVDGQGVLLARIDALEKALVEREQRIAELEAEVRSGDQKRASALARIDQIIDQLDELEGRAESASLPAVD